MFEKELRRTIAVERIEAIATELELSKYLVILCGKDVYEMKETLENETSKKMDSTGMTLVLKYNKYIAGDQLIVVNDKKIKYQILVENKIIEKSEPYEKYGADVDVDYSTIFSPRDE